MFAFFRATLLAAAAGLALGTVIVLPAIRSAAAAASQGFAMTHFVNSGPNRLSFNKTGHEPAVVVIHGIGGRKEDWAQTATTLSASHTVYTVDMLGFGGSSKSGTQITIAEQVAAIVALLDSEKVKHADLIGNSVGGWVAATFAADHPDRTNRLVRVDAAGFKAMFEGKPPVDFYPQDTAAMANLLDHVRFDAAAKSPSKVEQSLAASKASGDATAAEAVGKGMFVSSRLEDVADRVQSSALVIWGANNGLFPTAIADLLTELHAGRGEGDQYQALLNVRAEVDGRYRAAIDWLRSQGREEEARRFELTRRNLPAVRTENQIIAESLLSRPAERSARSGPGLMR